MSRKKHLGWRVTDERAARRSGHALWMRLQASLVGRFWGTRRRKRGSVPLYPRGPSADQLYEEAAKQRRVPGIVFADGPTGRRARIAGTGIEVFEVLKTFRTVGEDRMRLAASYDWLSSEQLDAALAYALTYPQEMARRLELEEALESKYRGAHRNP